MGLNVKHQFEAPANIQPKPMKLNELKSLKKQRDSANRQKLPSLFSTIY